MLNIIINKLQQNKSQKLHCTGLVGLGLAHLVSVLCKEAKQFFVLITPDSLTSQRIEAEIKFFLGEQSNIPVLHFADRETLPYDVFSPHQDIISERLKILSILPLQTKGILLVNLGTLLHYLLPPDYLQKFSLVINQKTKIQLDAFKNQLSKNGYIHVGQVMEPGEFSVRGSLIDLYPSGSDLPYRIELFDDEIESLRTFDPETQRTITKVDYIELLPAREYPLTEEAITLFRQQWRSHFSGNPLNSPIYQTISEGNTIAGIEYYLPLFYESVTTLFSYLPKNSVILKTANLTELTDKFWVDVKSRFEQRTYDITKPLLAPELLFLRADNVHQQLNQFSQIQLSEFDTDKNSIHFNYQAIPDIKIDKNKENPLIKLNDFLATKAKTLICAESPGRRESLLKLFQGHIKAPIIVADFADFITKNINFAITVAPIEQGVILPESEVTVISEAQIFGLQVLQTRRRLKQKTFESDGVIRDLMELSIGAPIVHLQHGIGRYQGLQKLKVGDIEAEFLTMEYQNGDKLYVPVSSLHLISRYSGPDIDKISLHKLGTDTWEKAKKKAAEKIRDVAAELLLLQAQRKAKTGYTYQLDDSDYARFAAEFAFELTPDQEKAIQDIYGDMQTGRAMDRLVCGDVGFGKTEVAMRAAFLAVMNNKQVAVLVPTTLLAQQHYDTFSDRFADWPIRIGVLSRFQSTKTQKQLLESLQERKYDIVVGTHKLLQTDIEFNDLGLLIIDEEHRFGVQQKEKIKKLRHEVDILTLTATPIPRTMNMAMSGIRDLSLITTPPARRLVIKTFLNEYNQSIIREAILREIARGGQVYYLHNDVATIQKCAADILQLVPEIKIAVAHGQMPERELERVMADFYHHRFNVLVCSTIIESGIDIPSANTIIIERADKFGLAQLHQLRGRVGRSHHQAYAYLLIPPAQKLTRDAEKRLEAITKTEDLGAGFMLATHDLEIRGAGELLGEEQSGQMEAIGFNLYMDLLERAVNSLKQGQNLENIEASDITEIDIKIPALLPEDYMPDVHQRLIFYKRIANAKSIEQLDHIQVELIDRFGLLPISAKHLFSQAELKLQAEKLGIKKIDAGMKEAVVWFNDKPNVKPERLIALIQEKSQIYKFDGPQKLRVVISATNETIFEKLHGVLGELI